MSRYEYRWIALLVMSLGTLGGVLNGSSLIIALPTIMLTLHTTLLGVMAPLVVYLLVTTITARSGAALRTSTAESHSISRASPSLSSARSSAASRPISFN